jgi:hypothetical protein
MSGPVYVTPHAFQRAQERLGWQGTVETFAAYLGTSRALCAALALRPTGQWLFTDRALGLRAIMHDTRVVTVYQTDGIAASRLRHGASLTEERA